MKTHCVVYTRHLPPILLKIECINSKKWFAAIGTVVGLGWELGSYETVPKWMTMVFYLVEPVYNLIFLKCNCCDLITTNIYKQHQ